jgi:glutathione S-transferase
MNCGAVRLNVFSAGLKNDIARIDTLWNEDCPLRRPVPRWVVIRPSDAFCPVTFRVQTCGRHCHICIPVRRAALARAMQSWYAAALGEHWRNAGHEAELAQVRPCCRDLPAIPLRDGDRRA